jgi:hypothetical protein
MSTNDRAIDIHAEEPWGTHPDDGYEELQAITAARSPPGTQLTSEQC